MTAPTSIEQTPLLSEFHKRDVYDRFSPRRKRVIVAIVSLSGLIPLFVSGSFVPSIPQIARDLNSTGPVISLAVSLSIFVSSSTSLAWAVYSGFYGRRPIYLCSLPFFCFGSIGVGMANSVPTLMVNRVIQAFGAGAGMSVGSAVIADICRLEERGTAMGIFFAAILLGPALAPLCGGIATAYFTWRHMQYSLFVAGLVAYLLVLFFLPETSHPGGRGIDKVAEGECDVRSRRPRFVWLNPFKGLWLLRSPNLMAITFVGSVAMLTTYVLLIPLGYTIGKRYNITNEATIGAIFLPCGLGNLIGAPIAGRFSDNTVIKWRQRRHGEWVAEDRLRAAMSGAVALVPLSILLSGTITTFIPGTTGLILNLLCLFANGIGVDFVLTPTAAYMVDVMHSQSAEIMAANNAFRGLILAVFSSGVLASVDALGVFYTNLISAALVWFGAGLLWLTIRYGDRMRAYVDVGFSTIETT